MGWWKEDHQFYEEKNIKLIKEIYKVKLSKIWNNSLSKNPMFEVK